MALLLASQSVAAAALPIELEIAMQPGTPLAAPQEWAQLLGKMDLVSVRLRGIRASERPHLETTSRGNGTHYRLLGILNQRNELVLPERRFRIHDRHALEKHFQQLPAQAAYNAQPRGRFGLTEQQFRQVYTALSQPVGFSTLGKSAGEVLLRIEKGLSVPVIGTDKLRLLDGKPLQAELRDLSAGTALAFALRQAGWMLLPEQLPGQTLRLSVAPFDHRADPWPVGWKPAVSSRQSAPQLFELRNIEIEGFTLNQALTALGPALKLPVITDGWILEQHEIDPNTIQVSLPKKRTYLKSAVGKILSQARLAEEVRVDELEQPFLWVTRFGKSSRPAMK
jgi:hypothetical protein